LEIELPEELSMADVPISQEFFGDVPYYARWEQEYAIIGLRLQDLVAYEDLLISEPLENLYNNENYKRLNSKLGFRSAQYLVYYDPHIELTDEELIGTFIAPGSIAGILGSAKGLGLVSKQKKTGFAWEGTWLLE
ncbi:hypothetical protein ACFL1U_00410, partial [Patescibacteria group bacterium]